MLTKPLWDPRIAYICDKLDAFAIYASCSRGVLIVIITSITSIYSVITLISS